MNSGDLVVFNTGEAANATGSLDENIKYVEEDTSSLIGKRAVDLGQIQNMYNDHAFLHGFGTRRSTSHLSSRDKKITSKKFVCCKEGEKIKPKEGDDPKNSKYIKHEERTKCKAHIVAKPTAYEQEWEVTKHVMEHNHPFTTLSETHKLLSHRFIPKQQVEMLQSMVQAGIRKVDAYKYIRHQANGSPMLGFSLKDTYNVLERRKKMFCAVGDAQALIRIFEDVKIEDPEFFYAYKLDELNQLESVFWRDRLMKVDYQMFHDLTVFDTTFKTNKYGLSCGPFVCMNHHGRNLLVGCGFVKSETISSFKWLFDAFKESMEGIEPVTMMTDQDAAMANAIQHSFPNARHRLCTWHIGENAKKHLPHCFLKEGFSNLFDQVLRRCYTQHEFETNWNSLRVNYELVGNRWIENLYTLKDKWCNVYSNDVFSGGALASQRSESTNSCINRKRRTTNGLVDCYFIFCDLIKEWRRSERDDNLNDKLKLPTVALPQSKILKQARSIYTIRAYQLFEEEYKNAEGCRQVLIKTCAGPDGSKGYVYQVFQKRNPQLMESKVIVRYREIDKAVKCECEKLVSHGMLCCHALRIMNIHCVEEIPQAYYLRRWTRKARPPNFSNSEDGIDGENEFQTKHWQLQLQRSLEKILSASGINPTTRKICEDGLLEIRHKVELVIGTIDLEENMKGGEECQEETTETTHESILNPAVNRKKGQRTERFKSITEKVGRKNKRAKNSNPPRQQTQTKNPATNAKTSSFVHRSSWQIQDGDSNLQTSSMGEGIGLQFQSDPSSNTSVGDHETAPQNHMNIRLNMQTREGQDGDSNLQTSSMGEGIGLQFQSNPSSNTSVGDHETAPQNHMNIRLNMQTREGQDEDSNVQTSILGEGLGFQCQSDKSSTTRVGDHETLPQNLMNIRLNNFAHEPPPQNQPSQIQFGGNQVYVPRLESTEFSEFEGGPSTSGVGNVGRNLTSMEKLLFGAQGMQKGNYGLSSNERFTDFFLN